MTEKIEIVEDLRERRRGHKEWIEHQMALPGWGRLGTVEGILRNDACKDIERLSRAEQRVKELEVSPEALSEQLTHSRTCSAGFDLDADCTCGLDYRIQLQTEQNIRAAWMKRALEAEQENTALLKAVTDEGAEVVNRVTAKVIAARAGQKREA